MINKKIQHKLEENHLRVQNIVAESTRCSSPSYNGHTPRSAINVRKRSALSRPTLLTTDTTLTRASSNFALPPIHSAELKHYLQQSPIQDQDEPTPSKKIRSRSKICRNLKRACHSAKRMDLSAQMFSDVLQAIRINSQERQHQLDEYREKKRDCSGGYGIRSQSQTAAANTNHQQDSRSLTNPSQSKIINVRNIKHVNKQKQRPETVRLGTSQSQLEPIHLDNRSSILDVVDLDDEADD